jgi:hypothetical protein
VYLLLILIYAIWLFTELSEEAHRYDARYLLFRRAMYVWDPSAIGAAEARVLPRRCGRGILMVPRLMLNLL